MIFRKEGILMQVLIFFIMWLLGGFFFVFVEHEKHQITLLVLTLIISILFLIISSAFSIFTDNKNKALREFNEILDDISNGNEGLIIPYLGMILLIGIVLGNFAKFILKETGFL